VRRDEPRLATSQVSDHHRITVIHAHLTALDHGLMDPAPALYTIRVNGHLGAMMLSAFPAMQSQLAGAETVLTGLLDRSALYGVLAEIDALGLDLLEVRQLIPDSEGGQQLLRRPRADPARQSCRITKTSPTRR
jgi:hypothetical protein